MTTTPDGTAWARGTDWKAGFSARGITFVPFLGSAAERNHPLALELVAATAGGTPLALDRDAPPRVHGARIELARGSVVERYDLTRDHVEQSFVVTGPARDGELRLCLAVHTDLHAAPTGDGGFLFTTGALGGVRYGRAIVFDANGVRTDVASTLAGEGAATTLTLSVPAAFVNTARWPLTIDPVIQTFSPNPGIGTPSLRSADCAHLGTFGGVNAIVHEEVFSAVDHDVFVSTYDRDGALGPSSYIEYTPVHFGAPQIASHRGASQFLVVAAVGAPGSPTTIHGCTLTYAGGAAPSLTPSGTFPIHLAGNGKFPDVGGDPNPGLAGLGTYCVTWEGDGLQVGELFFNLVRTDTSLFAANGQWLDPGPEFVSRPRVSKSNGGGGFTQLEWLVVWQKRITATNEDVHLSRISITGAVQALDVPIDQSPRSETNPEVSSPTDLTSTGQRYAVVYERAMPAVGPVIPARQNVFGHVCAGSASLSGPVNLSQFLPTDPLGDQRRPCVDTDGSRFVVGFTEDPAIQNQDTTTYLATLHVANDTFGLTTNPEALSTQFGPDDFVQLTSERSGGTFTPRYVATWQSTATATGVTDVHTAFYAGHLAFGPTSYFNHSIPGCGALTLAASGLPALNSVFTLDLTNAQGIPFLLFGPYLTNPQSVCSGCVLGVDLATAIALQTTHLVVFVPAESSLIGLQLGAQGIDLLAPGACTQPFDFALGNMLLITLL